MTSLKHIKVFLLFILTLAVGCSGDSKTETPQQPDTELTIDGISDTQWTYISLETNRKVGVSPLNDPKADEEWRNRTDWDIALCGDMIRTNSGTSGIGQGGIVRLDNQTYNQINEVPTIPLDIDRIDSEDLHIEELPG